MDVAQRGDEGLEMARAVDYDLIVLDIMLPGLDGWEVLRELRASGRATPVLLLTAKDGVPDRVKGLELGADDYLIKPFAFAELRRPERAAAGDGRGAGRAPRRGGATVWPAQDQGRAEAAATAHRAVAGAPSVRLVFAAYATAFSSL